MATEFCPCCRRPYPGQLRAGVRFTPFKTKLFDHIERQPGRSARDLAAFMYDGDVSKDREQTIRSHISQIRLALDETELKLTGGIFTGYYLEKRK